MNDKFENKNTCRHVSFCPIAQELPNIFKSEICEH